MDFELKPLSLARICSEKCDALLVLVPADMPTGDDAVSLLISSAIKAGDFEAKPGKLLNAYRLPGITATRLVLLGCGDGSAKNVRTAVMAAMPVAVTEQPTPPSKAAIFSSNAARVGFPLRV